MGTAANGEIPLRKYRSKPRCSTEFKWVNTFLKEKRQ